MLYQPVWLISLASGGVGTKVSYHIYRANAPVLLATTLR